MWTVTQLSKKKKEQPGEPLQYVTPGRAPGPRNGDPVNGNHPSLDIQKFASVSPRKMETLLLGSWWP